MDIQGSKGIFVGGASGMCRATAEQFHAKGGAVAILDLESSNGADVAAKLGGKFFPCNVTDYANTDQAIADAVATLGGLHFVLNTAGGGNRAVGGTPQRTVKKDGIRHPTDVFTRVIELNLIASFNINTAAAQHMAKNEANEAGERGVMINTSSIAAFEGQIGQVSYSAAKGGISAMTLTMARDLGSLGIRCMTIAPSLFATGLTARVTEEGAHNMTKDAAFPHRMGQPAEFATMAIAIFESPMMNGSTLRVDGGQRFSPR
ncbi:MAG: SDR family oxidoreductase [Chromatiales bacterium]|jgi:NAD(P)-dependent dehydrogenase (short-subunit alcohol dehydrogenase family)|nr:SDR family oxidoreductase [Chromatiales bacterium]